MIKAVLKVETQWKTGFQNNVKRKYKATRQSFLSQINELNQSVELAATRQLRGQE